MPKNRKKHDVKQQDMRIDTSTNDVGFDLELIECSYDVERYFVWL
jgi:hypothetical protein